MPLDAPVLTATLPLNPFIFPLTNYRKKIEEEWQRKVKVAIDTKSYIDPMETVITIFLLVPNLCFIH